MIKLDMSCVPCERSNQHRHVLSLETCSLSNRHCTGNGLDERILTLCMAAALQGYKSANERFAGALFTTSVEGFVPATGRGVQGATSHCLGQNFSNMFKIKYEAEDKTKKFAWQNSWGLSTRTIGVMITVHGDDKVCFCWKATYMHGDDKVCFS
jgi:prolyl-tRNA synthetase